MIIYFDTSAFVPLLISEPGTPLCQRLWNDADEVVTSRLLYVEAAAALAQAERLERLTEPEHKWARRLLDQLWDELDVVEVDEGVVTRAAELARTCALRGYDAVHCASAEQLDDTDLVLASGDRRLLDAGKALHLSVADVNS